jgi:hypothetical protein
MEAFFKYFNLFLSLSTAGFTIYFWLVKAAQERPRLRVHPAAPRIGGWARSSCGDPVTLVLDVKAVLANHSSQPNAVLGVRAWVRRRDGSWQEAEATPDVKTPLPLNLPPMQTLRLDLAAAVTFPALPEGDACRNTHETFALYRDRHLGQAPQVKVELTALGGRLFSDVLTSAAGSASGGARLARAA